MTMHDLGNALPAIIAIGFAVSGLLRLRARNARAAAERAAAQPRDAVPKPPRARPVWLPKSGPPVQIAERPRTPVRAPSPFASLNAPAAPPAPVAKIPARIATRAVAAGAPPQSGPDPLAPLAADAFPVLDLTLPGAAPAAGSAAPRASRRVGLPGSRGWGASGIVALEILGPPVSLRAGATLGAPHAF